MGKLMLLLREGMGPTEQSPLNTRPILPPKRTTMLLKEKTISPSKELWFSRREKQSRLLILILSKRMKV